MAKKAAVREAVNFDALFPVWYERLEKLGTEHGVPSGTPWEASVMEKMAPEVFAELLAIGREIDTAYRQAGYPKPGELGQHQAYFLHEWIRLTSAAAQGVGDEGLWDQMPAELGRELVTLVISLAKHVTKHGLHREIPQHTLELLIALFLAFAGTGLTKLALELAQVSKNKTILLLVESTLKQYAVFMASSPAEAVKLLATLGLTCAEKDLPELIPNLKLASKISDLPTAEKEKFYSILQKLETDTELTVDEKIDAIKITRKLQSENN